jgi:hypothetical protein
MCRDDGVLIQVRSEPVIAWEANPLSPKTFRRLVQTVLQPAEPAMSEMPKRRWYHFSIRDLLLVTVIVALAVGWFVERRSIAKHKDQNPPV